MILSDSHDNVEKVKKAISIARENRVSAVFHLGDFSSPFVIPLIMSDEYEFFGVFGNNDGDRLFLQRRAGGKILRSPNWVSFQGRKIYLMHEPRALYPAVKSQEYDFVFFGHTHRLILKKFGRTLTVNPGESCGYLTGKATCVLLDQKNSETKVVEL